MSQCVARAARTDRRCRHEAAEGSRQCLLHEAMPLNHEEIVRLKEQAYRLNHVAISVRQYQDLLDDRERLMQMRRKEKRDDDAD